MTINRKSTDYKAGYRRGATNERKAIKRVISNLSPSPTRDGILKFIDERIQRMKRKQGGVI